MALVVLLRGVNVGGHRTFRPSVLAAQLERLGAVNIGAAGTFVIRRPVEPGTLRREVARRLPFEADIAICEGREIVDLLSRDYFSSEDVQPDVVRFVSVLSAAPPRKAPSPPMSFPSSGRWLMRILARDNRFVVGMYRRHMKAIRYLGMLDRIFEVPVTTRNWNTLAAIARVLEETDAPPPGGWRQPAATRPRRGRVRVTD